MKYYSLNKKAAIVSFKEAVLKGLAEDRGLYFPQSITPLDKDFIQNISQYTDHEIGYEVINQFICILIPK